MLDISLSEGESILSPKEREERQERAQKLQRIDQEIEKILTMSRDEYAQQQ